MPSSSGWVSRHGDWSADRLRAMPRNPDVVIIGSASAARRSRPGWREAAPRHNPGRGERLTAFPETRDTRAIFLKGPFRPSETWRETARALIPATTTHGGDGSTARCSSANGGRFPGRIYGVSAWPLPPRTPGIRRPSIASVYAARSARTPPCRLILILSISAGARRAADRARPGRTKEPWPAPVVAAARRRH